MSQRINLNTTPNQFMPILYFSQGDIGRTFEIALTSSDGYSIPIGATVEMVATKPSGFGFTVSGSLTGNVATFVTTETMTSEWGRFPAEIVIKNNGDVIGTANFYLNGERNPHPEGTIDGDASTIIPQLTLLVERVETAASSVLDRQTVTQTLPAGSQASYSFDEETNTQTFGIPQGEAGAGAVDVTASAYSSSKTYAVGDYVIHNDYLYRCTTAITTAEAWTSGHWTQVLLGDEVSDVKSDLDDLISIRLGDNLINRNNVQVGKWVESSGGKAVITSNEYTADYGAVIIDVESISKITFSTDFTSLKIYNYFLTSSDGTIVSSATPNESLPYTINCSGGNRLYISLRNYAYISASQWIMANEGETAESYEPYSETDYLFGKTAKNYITAIAENITDRENLFNPTDVQVGKWVQQENGKAVITSNQYTTAYGAVIIDVRNIENLTFSTNFTSLRLYNYYLTDTDDTVISSATDNASLPYTINCNGADKLFVSLNNYNYISDGQWVMLNIGTVPKEYIPYASESTTRTCVYVSNTDTEIDVAHKMLSAFNVGNCDVFFEKGTYTLKDCYAYLIEKTGLSTSSGLPVGNGCRYYFNGSTIISNEPDDHFNQYRNILDSQWTGSDYEIYDCTLINNDGLYCIHDEGASSSTPYNHKYVNVKMISDSSQSGSKPFGCGTGFDASLYFDNCLFVREDEDDVCIAIHGPTTNPNNDPATLDLKMLNSYVNVHNIALNTFTFPRDTLNFYLFGNKFKTAFSNSNVNLIENNNTTI